VNFMQLRAALAFKRKLAPKGSNASQKELKKGDAKFGELNKKIDGLESKLAKLMTIGNNMKAKSIKDLNALDKTGRTNSLSSLMLKSPQGRSPVAGNRNPLTIEDGLASPTESELTDRSSVFKSPNALRRNMFLKNAKDSPNSIFKINFQMKNLRLPSDSPASQHGGDDNLNFLTTPKAGNMNKNGGKYSELRSIGTVETEQNLLSETNLLTSHRNMETNDRVEEEEKREEDIRKGSLEVAVNENEEDKAREGGLIFLQKTGKLRKFKPSQGELRKNINLDDKSSNNKVDVEDL